MDYKGRFLLLSIFCLAGCSTVSPEQKPTYEQGYRAAIKEQMRGIAAQFQGGNFPYYHWTSPIVQDVHVPAHISNGVFIPEHKELVIIKPGEWALTPGYPINAQDKETQHATHDMDVADITHLPQCVGQGHGTLRGNESPNCARTVGATN